MRREESPFVVPLAPDRSPLIGMALLVLGVTVLPVLDGLAKLLTQSYPVLQVVWARYFFHVVLLLPFVAWRYGRGMFRLQRPGLQLFRSLVLLLSTVCFFHAIAELALADTLALFFVYPFIVTALAPWLLGDPVGIWRWSAVAIGFAGVLVVLSPNLGSSAGGPTVAVMLAIAAGLVHAGYVIATRKMAGSDPAVVTLFWTGMVGTFATTAVLPSVWVTPTASDLAIMVSLGALAALGHYLIIVAHEWASAPQLAPFGYAEIVSGTIVGYLLFGDFPAVITWFGIAVIIGSGIVIAWREGLRARR